MTLVTPQTGPEGRLVRSVLVEEQTADRRASSTSASLIDSSIGRPLLMASSDGGMEIEEVAAQTRSASTGRRSTRRSASSRFQGRELAFELGLAGEPACGRRAA